MPKRSGSPLLVESLERRCLMSAGLPVTNGVVPTLLPRGSYPAITSSSPTAPGENFLHPLDAHIQTGLPTTFPVAIVTGLRSAAPDLRDLVASINYGGQWERTPVVANPDGTYAILATRTFPAAAAYPLRVALAQVPYNPAGPVLTVLLHHQEIATSVTVTDVPVPQQILQLAPGETFAGPLGSLSVPPGQSFVTTISWGDGRFSPAQTFRNNRGGYDVLGTHAYGQQGFYLITVVANSVVPPGMGIASFTLGGFTDAAVVGTPNTLPIHNLPLPPTTVAAGQAWASNFRYGPVTPGSLLDIARGVLR